jgi:nicotinamidase-related amidase
MKTQTALLVMDLQVSILNRINDPSALIQSVQMALSAARGADLQVIYVVIGFRKGFPEINPDNKAFAQYKQNPTLLSAMEEPVEIFPALAPKPADIIVTKRRVSAFSGSDLEIVLRARKLTHLVLAGVATGGVVLSTLRQAADLDFGLTVLSDCCTDMDEEIHRVLLTKVFPRQAEVITATQWADQINQAAHG